MKKLLALTLSLLMVFALAACGGTPSGSSQESSEEQPKIESTLELLNTVWGSYTEDEKFPAMGGDYETPTDNAPGDCDISDAENLSYLLTIPAESVSLIDSASSLIHMMNVNTFTGGAFHVADSANVETLTSSLRDAIASKHWMCGFPDKFVILTAGDYVVFAYGNEDLVNTFRDKVEGAYSFADVAYEEAIA